MWLCGERLLDVKVLRGEGESMSNYFLQEGKVRVDGTRVNTI